MRVVADTSALIALAHCKALDLLTALFDEVWVPEAVFHEVSVEGKPGAPTLKAFLDGRVHAVEHDRLVLEAISLGRGELEAMALYSALPADRLLIDDLRARKIARINNMQVIGSLGILLAANERGLVSEIRPFIERLRNSELHFGERLLEHALAVTGESR